MMMKMMMIVMMMVGIQALLSHIISYWLNHKIEDGSPYWKNYVLYIILITLEAILYIILLVIAMCYISFSPSWKLYYATTASYLVADWWSGAVAAVDSGGHRVDLKSCSVVLL